MLIRGASRWRFPGLCRRCHSEISYSQSHCEHELHLMYILGRESAGMCCLYNSISADMETDVALAPQQCGEVLGWEQVRKIHGDEN